MEEYESVVEERGGERGGERDGDVARSWFRDMPKRDSPTVNGGGGGVSGRGETAERGWRAGGGEEEGEGSAGGRGEEEGEEGEGVDDIRSSLSSFLAGGIEAEDRIEDE